MQTISRRRLARGAAAGLAAGFQVLKLENPYELAEKLLRVLRPFLA